MSTPKKGSADKTSEEYLEKQCTVVAQPLAGGTQLKRVYRLTKKSAKDKGVRRGVKDVVKAVRRGNASNCICVIAGDVSPIDVITHLPVLCEEAGVPYIFVPSKETLGLSSRTKRPTSCVLISCPKDKDLEEKYQEVVKDIKKAKK